MNMPKIRAAQARKLFLAAIAVVALGTLAIETAAARGRGGGGGGRFASSSVAGSRSMDANRVGGLDRSRVNTGNVQGGHNRVNTGNVNIGNDVDIDIDRGYGHGHCCGNDWYHPVAAGVVIGAVAVSTAAVVGSYYRSLPAGCTVVVKDGSSYHYCGSVYYRKTWHGNDVVYVVVAP